MLQKVDERNGKVVFKRTNPAGKPLCYLVFPVDGIGDSTQGKEFATLGEARGELPPIPDTSEKTAPKSANVQNAAGYKASNDKSKH